MSRVIIWDAGKNKGELWHHEVHYSTKEFTCRLEQSGLSAETVLAMLVGSDYGKPNVVSRAEFDEFVAKKRDEEAKERADQTIEASAEINWHATGKSFTESLDNAAGV